MYFFAMNIDKLNLAPDLFTFRNLYKRSNSMVFGFQKMMDFSMDIDKLNLANLVGKMMDDK